MQDEMMAFAGLGGFMPTSSPYPADLGLAQPTPSIMDVLAKSSLGPQGIPTQGEDVHNIVNKWNVAIAAATTPTNDTSQYLHLPPQQVKVKDEPAEEPTAPNFNNEWRARPLSQQRPRSTQFQSTTVTSTSIGGRPNRDGNSVSSGNSMPISSKRSRSPSSQISNRTMERMSKL
jgi:hypothetical protein